LRLFYSGIKGELPMSDGVVARETTRGGMVTGLIVLVIAAVALAGAGWWIMHQRQHERTPEGVEEILLKDRTAAPLYRALKDNYPQEFAALRVTLSQKLQAGGTPREVVREMRGWLGGFTRRHLAELAQAPHGDLVLYRQLEIDLAERLERENITACAHFGMASLGEGDKLSREAEIQLVDFAAQQITVSAAGRDHPMNRKFAAGQLDQADAVAMVQAVRKAGMTQHDFDVWTNTARLDRAPATQQCAINRYMLRGIDSLPAAQADRITAWLAITKTRT
jgi:hypothetical protein